MDVAGSLPLLAPWQTFFANHNQVVGTLRCDGPRPDRDPGDDFTVDHAQLAAFGDALRAAGYDNTAAGGPLARLALGYTVPRDDVAVALPGSVLAGLSRCGIAGDLGPAVRLNGAILTAGGVSAYLPRDGSRPDRVYVGADTALLVAAIERLGEWAGDHAADLGTGTGVVAAALAMRHRLVVATDVTARSARTALVTAALNRFPAGHRLCACVADVARGLRPGTFDMVTANTPWVPSGDGGAGRRFFADGGPTGFELPRRFLTEGAALLGPGGILVALAAEVTFAGGRSALRDVCDALDEDGFTTAVLPTGLDRYGWDAEGAVLPRVEGAVAAAHVAIVVVRRPVPAGLPDAVADLQDMWAGREAVLH